VNTLESERPSLAVRATMMVRETMVRMVQSYWPMRIIWPVWYALLMPTTLHLIVRNINTYDVMLNTRIICIICTPVHLSPELIRSPNVYAPHHDSSTSTSTPLRPHRTIDIDASTSAPDHRHRRLYVRTGPSTSTPLRPHRTIDIDASTSAPDHRHRRLYVHTRPSTSTPLRPHQTIDIDASTSPPDVSTSTPDHRHRRVVSVDIAHDQD
jgi:hypothetical protein